MTETSSAPLVTAPTFAPGLAVLSGITSLVLGIMVLVWPDATLTVVAVLFGLQLALAGVLRIAVGSYSAAQQGWVRGIFVMTGVLMVLAGIVCLRHPVLSVAVIIVLTGVGWLVDGIAVVVVAANADEGRVALYVVGAASVVAAVVLLSAPVSSTHALLLLGGWLLVGIGVLTIVTRGQVLRGALAEPTAARA